MDEIKLPPGQCSICKKRFGNLKLRNRHIKRVHKITVSLGRKTSVLCPLCQENNKSYNELRNHIKDIHGMENEIAQLDFLSVKAFQTWKDNEKIETMYAIDRSIKCKNYKEIHYACNRSKTRNYKPLQQQRTEKAGGTIKINGICPSKLIVKLFETEKVSVTFWKSHAGHDNEELRSKHLSRIEKDAIVKKLEAGVPVSRVLDDARKMDNPKLERINLLNNKDVNYLMKKNNIEKKRHHNNDVAVRMKIPLSLQRPDASNYQDRIITKAHKLATELFKSTKVEQSDVVGEFKVKTSNGETFHTVTLKQICEKQCRTLYCRVCKICIHRYQCTCPQFLVKNTLCKHIHLTRMHESGINTSVMDDFAEILGENSQTKAQVAQEQEEICDFMNSKLSNQQNSLEENPAKQIKIEREELHKWIDTLDDNSFKRFLGNIKQAISIENRVVGQASETTKRKMETQT